ncbi:MAG: bifunctional serine/threonine-protein kinase/formylglycine-generating enzyme family protein [Pyrinomonadaceae bacterium]
MRECQLCKNCFSDDVNPCPNDGMPTVHTLNGEPVLEGKYHLESRIGQGGMGIVYRSRHAYLKTLHAIKIILPDLVGNDPQLVTRFRQEALAAAAIRHQNVVGVSDYGVIDGNIPFLVMEYVDGESLHDLLTREGALSPERALELTSAICAGVGAAHHQGIVHRDLKPLNVMICRDKPDISHAVKILDFGLAKIKSGELLGSFIQAQTTGLMGSPYYMAPEQWADDDPDSRSDVYSIGVMLFQMLAGDVPFKGSSIPAIMKKHISDPPPTFAEYGIRMPPEVEEVVRHTLHKDQSTRTPSVEALVREFVEAVSPAGLHTTGTALPVSSLRIRTHPPVSRVFVDNVHVGETRDNGWLLLEGIQSGNHHLRISHPGFRDWQGDVVCDGQPQEVMAQLRNEGDVSYPSMPAIPKPATTGAIPAPETMLEAATQYQQTHRSHPSAVETSQANWQTGNQAQLVESEAPKKSIFSPLAITLTSVLGLVALAVAGIGGAYVTGYIGGEKPTPTPNVVETPAVSQFKPELILIPGGSFRMGRNEGPQNARPEHTAEVSPFRMDTTEVTNGEFFEFMKESGYSPADVEKFLAHWENDKPIAGQELLPVRYVNVEDIRAFIVWRSKRDSVEYRLPTEKEWEFAARNGNKNDLYPWGDTFDGKCAVLDTGQNEPAKVGTKSCPNDWGVQDLIGNVFEWTSSDATLYPGNTAQERADSKEPFYMVRGGGAIYKSTGDNAINSTFRADLKASTRSPGLGFRLVTSN